MDIINISGDGFQPLKDYNSWRIAQIGYAKDTNSIDSVSTLGRHRETDEVFVLLEGEALMVTAGFQEVPGEIEVQVFEKNKLYVVKEKQWHAAVLKPETRLLVVENLNTSGINSNTYNLSKAETNDIKKMLSDYYLNDLK